MVAEKFVVLISRQDDQADVTSHGQFNSSAIMWTVSILDVMSLK